MQNELTALLEGHQGHFQMESGYHSDQWYHLGQLFDQRERLAPFVAVLAKKLAAHRIDVVCGPVSGGAVLAELIARELGVEAAIAERFEPTDATGLFPVKYLVPPHLRESMRGRRVAIVDDAISAGSAIRGTYSDLLACRARPMALGALFVFGGAAERFAHEHALALEAVAPLPFGLWKPSECPLCRSGVPVEKVSDASSRP